MYSFTWLIGTFLAVGLNVQYVELSGKPYVIDVLSFRLARNPCLIDAGLFLVQQLLNFCETKLPFFRWGVIVHYGSGIVKVLRSIEI